MQINEFDVVEKVSTLIGEPVPAEIPPQNQPAVRTPQPVQQQKPQFTPLRRTSSPANKTITNTSKQSSAFDDGEGSILKPIAHLNPFQQRWTIKARCTHKGPIRTFMRDQQEGKVCSVEFIDESGTIRATMFGGEVDEFYPNLETGKVSRCLCFFLHFDR